MNVTTASIGAALALLLAGTAVSAERPFDFGQFEYASSCASCHGPTGKGDGPMAADLVTPPTDLTTLAKRNGGVFPAQRVYEIIDGREAVKAHGSREMPVWGQQFRRTIPKLESLGMGDFGPSIAHARIASVIDYLYRIQE
jgi:mono/diheme cytochrome c family protein